MRAGFFGKLVVVVGLGLGFSSFAHANSETSNEKCTSGFQCIGGYPSEVSCSTVAADACADAAAAACAAHGAHVASMSCESCGYGEAVMSQEAQPQTILADTCPQPGQASGWYARMWYTCDN